MTNHPGHTVPYRLATAALVAVIPLASLAGPPPATPGRLLAKETRWT
ncbi:MAG TPA: hypothetical protein VHT71_16100 [Methylomirabilota bacterium]|jgi:hypothetical protein|nr:hypothetical protein [Methylomirabilota bacterium]